MTTMKPFTKTRAISSILKPTAIFRSPTFNLSRRINQYANYSSSLSNTRNLVKKNIIIEQVFSKPPYNISSPLGDIKLYSTCSKQSDDDSLNSICYLNPEEYESWNKVQVCSLLCAEKKYIRIEDVKDLYEGGFNGKNIAEIVKLGEKADEYDEKKKIFPKVRYDTISTVVHWVEQLIKTRFYHLWSDEKIREYLVLPIEKGGAGLLASDLNDFESLNQVNNPDISQKIQQWKKNFSIKVQMKEVQELIGIRLSSFNGDISYQNNNNDNILTVGKLLLHNQKIKSTGGSDKDLYLFVNSAQHGFGKTRFGIEFIQLFKKYLSNNPQELKLLVEEFGQQAVENVINAKLVYIHMTLQYSERTFTFLKNMIPNDDNSYLVVLDSFSGFCEIRGKSYIEVMLDVWNETIKEIQTLPNVLGVYLCGKGTFIDSINETLFQKRPPTLCHRVDLHSLSRNDLDLIFQQCVPEVYEHLKQLGIYEFTLTQILAETGGVPLLVNNVIRLFSGRGIPPEVDSKQQVLNILYNILPQLQPPVILQPIYACEIIEYHTNEFIMYSFLMFLSQAQYEQYVKLDSKTKFDSQQFESLKLFKSVDIVTLVAELGGYISACENSEFKLVFPRGIVKNYKLQIETFSLAPFVKLIPQFFEKKYQVFETLIDSFIYWSSIVKTYEKSTWGNAIPFLRGTCIEKESCVELIPSQTNMKLENESEAKRFWENVYNSWTVYENKLNYMMNQSMGPQKFVVFSQDLWWCIKYMNKDDDEFCFTELSNEMEKFAHFPSQVNIIVTLIYRNQIPIKEYVGVFNPGSTINEPRAMNGQTDQIVSSVKQIKLAQNVTLIISDEKMVQEFIGSSNMQALKELNDLQ